MSSNGPTAPKGATAVSVGVGENGHVFLRLHDERDQVFAYAGMPPQNALKVIAQMAQNRANFIDAQERVLEDIQSDSDVQSISLN